MDCSPPGSSVHGISQARILEWVAICFSRESSQLGLNPCPLHWQADSILPNQPPGSSSVDKSCLTLCNPTNCTTPGFSVLHYLPEIAQTSVHWVSDAIQPSRSLSPPFPLCPQSFPASGSFPMSPLFAWGGQSIVASALASVPPMNIQDWFPLGWTGLISLLSKGLSRVFSNTTVQKHQFQCSAFFMVQLISVHDY